MRSVLDTSVLVAGLEHELPGELAISAASLAELHFGVLVASDATVRAERLRRLTFLHQEFEAIPVDHRVAASYGQLAAAVVSAGRTARSRSMDLIIAATAHAHGARLVTRNTRDLAGIGDLVEIVEL
ncbi:MAG: type II toxin-antitoxin system VapC family toxin [Ilumatobacteraceae bacterium]